MVKDDIDTLIDQTRTNFENNNTVAFLGIVNSGKTVVSTLLYYHLISDWIPKNNERWEAIPTSGDDAIYAIIKDMKQGKFTDPTPKNEFPKITVNVHSMEGIPSKTELVLHDISGEKYTDMLTQDRNVDDVLTELLSGDGAYLVYAKQYVIMVNCEQRVDWDIDICRVVKMLTMINEIKQKIHRSQNKINTPISVIFTKADRLSKDEQNKEPKELLDEYPGLKSSLNINHDGKSLQFFKVHVESKEETDAEVKERTQRILDDAKNNFNHKMKTIKDQIDAAVKQAQKTIADTERAKKNT